MVTVCAWCQRYMGSKEPFANPAVSHGICPPCQQRQMAEMPVVVVSPDRVSNIPLIQSLLQGAPDVAIVVDRRSRERRNGHDRSNGHGEHHPAISRLAEDRRSRERRRSVALYVV